MYLLPPPLANKNTLHTYTIMTSNKSPIITLAIPSCHDAHNTVVMLRYGTARSWQYYPATALHFQPTKKHQ